MRSTPPIQSPETFEPPVQGTQPGFTLVPVSETRQVVPEAVVERRVGVDRAQALSRRIGELYEQIANGAITDGAKTSEAMSHLRIARDKELEDPRQFDEAEYLVNVAQFIVTRAGQVRQWTAGWGVLILFYGLIALAVFTLGLVLDRMGVVIGWLKPWLSGEAAKATSLSSIFEPYTIILWGGLGGVLGLLYSLIKHTAMRQDFDRQYVLWYFGQPFLGMLMGTIVYLFIVAGVFGLIQTDDPAVSQAIAALVAVAAAFRQNYIYAWLEWLLKSIQPGGREADGTAGKPATAETVVTTGSESSGVG